MKQALLAALLCGMASCHVQAQTPQNDIINTLEVKVTNTMKTSRTSQPIVLPLKDYGHDIHQAIVALNGQEVASQLDDLDGDGIYDELCFLADLAKKASATFTVQLLRTGEPRSYTPQVYVDMMLTNKKIKSSNKQDLYINSLTVCKGTNPYWQLHHHGPAFENDMVAYRIYFDHRQTVDIYGKYRRGLELHATQFYPDQQQKEAGFGDDVLWVGNTFGLGTLRGWDGTKPVMLTDVARRTERIISGGPLRTIVEVIDQGWQGDKGNAFHPSPLSLTTRYTLYAGRRDCQVDLAFKQSALNHQFATGIINIKNSIEESDGKGLRGCWGTDWPVSAKDSVGHKRETVGLGICLPQQHIVSELPANKDNYPFVIGHIDHAMRYYITFGSDNESFGYHSAASWFQYLKEWKADLEHPVVVSIQSVSSPKL